MQRRHCDRAHLGEVLQTAAGSWWAVCACGWLGDPDSDRAVVEAAFGGHAVDAALTQAAVDRSAELPAHPDQRTGRIRHQQLKSGLVQGPNLDMRFQARCSCGWESAPVPMGLTFAVWDEHFGSKR